MSKNAIFENAPLRMKACRYGTLMYLANDTYIGRSLDLYGEFSEGEAQLFQQIVRPGMIVVDIGANVGVHTVCLAKATGTSGRVIAFEPQRAIYHMLCGNLALNNCSNAVALHAALGREPGTVTVPRIDYTNSANSGGLALGQWTQGDQVQILTLDSLDLDPCHFVKIDVEGMEIQVLEGARKTLVSRAPILYVENDRASNSAGLIEWLLERGYRLYWHLPALFNPANHFGNSENVFGGTISINMLGIPASRPISVKGFREITSPHETWRG
jgi:FkbM family methyltransferase